MLGKLYNERIVFYNLHGAWLHATTVKTRIQFLLLLSRNWVEERLDTSNAGPKAHQTSRAQPSVSPVRKRLSVSSQSKIIQLQSGNEFVNRSFDRFISEFVFPVTTLAVYDLQIDFNSTTIINGPTKVFFLEFKFHSERETSTLLCNTIGN